MKTLLFWLLCTTVLLWGCSTKYSMPNNQEVLRRYWYDILIHCFQYIKTEWLEDTNIKNNCFMEVSKWNVSEYDVISKITYWYY